jgi:hypothetical protein
MELCRSDRFVSAFLLTLLSSLSFEAGLTLSRIEGFDFDSSGVASAMISSSLYPKRLWIMVVLSPNSGYESENMSYLLGRLNCQSWNSTNRLVNHRGELDAGLEGFSTDISTNRLNMGIRIQPLIMTHSSTNPRGRTVYLPPSMPDH